jgi:6-pyruvoyl-tetrahydropterin synthase related domain
MSASFVSRPLSAVRRLPSLLRRPDPYLWLVVAFALFAVLPLAGPGYFFDAHDAPHSVFFLTEFDAALRDGVWYPGWATDQALGYGYPTFVLYPPLAYYVAEAFHLLGAGKVAAVKWTWALATLGAGLAMYVYGRHALGRQRGLLAAIVYVYVPYHLLDIYVRADLAEYCAFVWMPLALLAFHRLAEAVTARRLGLAGLVYGALWLTHNVTALVFTPVLAAYVLFCLLARQASWQDRFARAFAALGGALLGLGVAAALLLPNLFERAYIVQAQWVRAGYDYALNFLYPAHLLSASWGYAPGRPGTESVMSFQLGAVPLILAGVAAVGTFRRQARNRALGLFFVAATILPVLFMLPLSAPLWGALPLAALIQFPWRLLALTAVTLSVLSGLAIPPAEGTKDQGREARLNPLVLALSLVAVLGSFPYTLPQYTPIPDIAEGPLLSLQFEQEYGDMVGMTAWTKELPSTSPLVAQYLAGGPLVTAEALAPGAAVEMIRTGGASDEMWVRSPGGTALRFYTYYFPGWRATVDGQPVEIRADGPNGLIGLDVPSGEHDVQVTFGTTPPRVAGQVLSAVGLLGLGVLLALGFRKFR